MSKNSLLKWLQEGNISIPGVLLSQYKEMNLNEHELVLILHVISYIEHGNKFPTPVELSSRMTISVAECTEMLRKLIQKGFIDIKDSYSADGIRYESYHLDPLWEKLIDQFLLSGKKRKLLRCSRRKQIFIPALKGSLAGRFHLLNVKHLLFGWMMTTMIPIL